MTLFIGYDIISKLSAREPPRMASEKRILKKLKKVLKNAKKMLDKADKLVVIYTSCPRESG